MTEATSGTVALLCSLMPAGFSARGFALVPHASGEKQTAGVAIRTKHTKGLQYQATICWHLFC